MLKILRCLFAGFFVLIVTGCATSGYKQFYQPAQGLPTEKIAARRPSPPPENPIVERARPAEPGVVVDAYAKRSYVMIGSSMFNSGHQESDASAVKQAKEVGADLVLILNPSHTGTVTSAVPITTPTTSTTYSSGTATAFGGGRTATAYGSGTSTTYGSSTTYVPMTVNRFDYGAVFFVKQKFSLGAFFRDLNNSERQELQTNKGAVIRVVVDDTPAFHEDLLVGDIVSAVNGEPVTDQRGLSALLEKYRGQKVTFSLIRRGQRLDKSLQLQVE